MLAMAQGLIPRAQTGTNHSFFLLSFKPKFPLPRCKFPFMLPPLRLLPLPRCFCRYSSLQEPIDLCKYREAFSKRMDMAGLKPHHRIALGVSGGPDSMALCVLTAVWKMDGLTATGRSSTFIDGLLAIVVDHGLRAESRDEAKVVSNRITQLGIRCEIASCDWLNGKPKQGHLQEAARDMRYQMLQKVCVQHQIGVILVAHHADDQAELFILRLSRSSGVLGLAGMPFTSQIFSSHTYSYSEVSKNYGVLLVRPLMDFSKDDMYKICQGANQDWVEDPTNRSSLFARNRIRMSLGDLSSGTLNSELHAIISACRKTRLFVDQVCLSLANWTLTITELGYAIIDLEILNQLKPQDICLSKFVSLVLQFISQRHRPVRGNTAKLVLDYIQTVPCKTSLTAAGCYVCPAPGSKGTRCVVCCSVDCPLPSEIEVFHAPSYEEERNGVSDGLEQIINDGKSYLEHFIPKASDVHFLDATPESVLDEAKKLNIISESTYRIIVSLQMQETKLFKAEPKVTPGHEPKHGSNSVRTSSGRLLKPGQICNYMNRFFITWKIRDEIEDNSTFEAANRNTFCKSCVLGCNMELEVRHMIESDWLYLSKLSECTVENFQDQRDTLANLEEQTMENTNRCLNFARSSAREASVLLKLIPVAARRSLPVLVNQQGLLLSIPSVRFSHCPWLMASAVFKPRVPFGGGHSSFM
ncbi:uncharacterized protein LOC120071467 [Benincasa hispida]|uniref:uncharacterized protein LOC120071467 n=1 Tax=Benincasa hispida TaxID=102211 RepID=UPI0019001A3A|nr:uncharacterized protein LOC120071467 [Benincasa hispida]XP_038879704.1 uncharacterized protein LOC120071467 [Benincasa hispida]